MGDLMQMAAASAVGFFRGVVLRGDAKSAGASAVVVLARGNVFILKKLLMEPVFLAGGLTAFLLVIGLAGGLLLLLLPASSSELRSMMMCHQGQCQ